MRKKTPRVTCAKIIIAGVASALFVFEMPLVFGATLGEDLLGGGRRILNISALTIGTPILPLGRVANITGDVHIDGSIYALNLGGENPIPAGNVSSGIFGSYTGWGNYTFKNELSINPTLFVDVGNERVGIGTANPLEKLDVRGSTFATGRISASG
ncbi:MAG: hypothetical protein Q8R12_00690, partial [bacterium]|nr:hypothetical protein [bacterium]